MPPKRLQSGLSAQNPGVLAATKPRGRIEQLLAAGVTQERSTARPLEKSGFHTRMWRRSKGTMGSQDPGIAPYTGLERECGAKRVGRVLNPNFSLLKAWTLPVFTKVRWFGYRTRLVTKGCFPMGPFTDGERLAAGPYGLETPRSEEGTWCPGVNSAVSCCKNQTNPAALQLCVLNRGCFLRPVLAPSRHGASLSRAVLALCPESQKPRGR